MVKDNNIKREAGWRHTRGEAIGLLRIPTGIMAAWDRGVDRKKTIALLIGQARLFFQFVSEFYKILGSEGEPVCLHQIGAF